ncbi:hypothetical protein ACJX0J_024061, partial [Zea mays]
LEVEAVDMKARNAYICGDWRSLWVNVMGIEFVKNKGKMTCLNYRVTKLLEVITDMPCYMFQNIFLGKKLCSTIFQQEHGSIQPCLDFLTSNMTKI